MNEIKIPTLTFEKLFIYISIFFGILFIFLTPPFESPDESSHFYKAYSVSKGELFPTIKNGIIGSNIENSIYDYTISRADKVAKEGFNRKYSFSNFFFEQYLPRQYTGETFINYPTAYVPFVAYLPSSIGILAAKTSSIVFYKMSAPTSFILYFARLFNLLFYIMVCYYAIKKTPILKKTMFFVALLPISLFLASMVSYDGLLLSLSLLFLANFFDLYFSDKDSFIDNKRMLLFIIIGFIFFNIKVVYITLFLLLFLLPKNKFNNNKRIKQLLFIGFSILIITIIFKIPSFVSNENIEKDLAVSNQIEFVIKNPIKYLLILISNIISQFSHQMDMLMGNLGILDCNLPAMIKIFMLIYLFFVGVAEISISKFNLKLKERILPLIIVVSTYALIYTALYIVWTKTGSSTIDGVQGRYFLPIIIPFFMIFSGLKIFKKSMFKKIWNYVLDNVIFISILTLIITLMTLLLRFWV